MKSSMTGMNSAKNSVAGSRMMWSISLRATENERCTEKFGFIDFGHSCKSRARSPDSYRTRFILLHGRLKRECRDGTQEDAGPARDAIRRPRQPGQGTGHRQARRRADLHAAAASGAKPLIDRGQLAV